MLTKRQQQTLDFIEEFQKAQPGAAPTQEQLRVGLGLASRGQPHALLRKLEALGCIRRTGKRTLEIIRPLQARAA